MAPDRNPSLLRVAQALDSPSIPAKVTMQQLWYLIPELRGQLQISRLAPYPALFIEDANFTGKTSTTALVWGLPHDFTHTKGWAGHRGYGAEAEREVIEYLSHYPSLKCHRFAAIEPPLSSGRESHSISWGDKPRIEKAHDGGVQIAMELEERLPVEGFGFNHPSEFPRNVALRKISFTYPSLGMRVAFPAITGNIKPLHPIIAWWAILYGLSMLARYEPSAWNKAININESRHAVILEILLDEAISACPSLIRQSLCASA
nr:YaaC family protein [Streptomyces sp. ODS25]